ncbi:MULTISPECIES: polysaccharide deacetylase family protein [unclassified Achromobacter]|uniref:polysaccharide deacetylase family protein n=1 Tax=unclassified Achromobacter TaxID=2626865 RepID=UPI000B51B110|nr:MULTISPECIES: polysaccharide deacetylase family protein [unclassified Achromobacter]OWT79912.1 chitin deacetylase [Achromobacter sp. HZ34]OWT81796.1 chitin deacetylase [Achromobacter sp. HZ28]
MSTPEPIPAPSTSSRDFVGYGGRPPAVRWPGDARVAVSFVVNFEEGAEFSMTDGDPRNEGIYEVIDPQPMPDACIDSHFEYGTRVAYWRIDELFAQYEKVYTLSACGRAVERSPWLARHATERGHELSAHGWRWQKHAGLAEAEERAFIVRTRRAIEAATGRAPVGWHTRSNPSPHTRRLLAEEGFLYDSDAYNDDTPYILPVAGRRHVVLPYAFDTNDMQFQNTQRFDTGDAFANYVCAAYDWLSREGATQPRMLSIGLHLRMIGRPARMGALERILRHIAESGGAWVATREQIARHWLDHAG